VQIRRFSMVVYMIFGGPLPVTCASGTTSAGVRKQLRDKAGVFLSIQ